MGPATERFYMESLESDEHQALLDEVSYRGAKRGLSKRDTGILLTEEWERFTLENFPDDAGHVDFAACAVRFINEHELVGVRVADACTLELRRARVSVTLSAEL